VEASALSGQHDHLVVIVKGGGSVCARVCGRGSGRG